MNKNELDVSKVFQTYIAFSGDVDKTAIALNEDREIILQLASAENWPAKVKQWNTLHTGDPKDVQIQINRAINYVQAHRLRSVVDRVIQHLGGGSDKELVDRLTVVTKHGAEFKSRILTDLVKAAESCQLMTQRALGDTAAERPEDGPERKGSDIALQVLQALNAADESGLDSVAVVRKQLDNGTVSKPSGA